jgi:hypothetical protein
MAPKNPFSPLPCSSQICKLHSQPIISFLNFGNPTKMTLDETLKLLITKEKKTGYLLQKSLSLKRYRQEPNINILQPSDAFYLPAVNSKARIKWGRIFIRQIFQLLQIPDDKCDPDEPVFLLTIADKSHLTTVQPQQINISGIKHKIAGALKGLSYIGMIEPGYYNAIYDEFGAQQKNVISWHGHFLVWGINQKDLVRHLARVKSRFTPIMRGLRAVHQKMIEPGQFGYKLWYMLKSPCKEYSIGKRRERAQKTGEQKFKQNSRTIRPGHRILLFQLMREMYLDDLAMAGREGRSLLRRIKYEAMREYRMKNKNDRRPCHYRI